MIKQNRHIKRAEEDKNLAPTKPAWRMMGIKRQWEDEEEAEHQRAKKKRLEEEAEYQRAKSKRLNGQKDEIKIQATDEPPSDEDGDNGICECCQRKVNPYEKSYSITHAQAQDVICRRRALDRHMSEAHPEQEWDPLPGSSSGSREQD